MVDWIRGPVATGSALLLAVIMVRAGWAKLRSRRQTEADFAALGLAAAGPLAVAVPAAELLVAALLIVTPGWGAVVAAALLTAFTAIIARVLLDPGGLAPSCACFGGSSRAPISRRHLVRNGLLLALAALAVSFDGVVSPLFAFVLY